MIEISNALRNQNMSGQNKKLKKLDPKIKKVFGEGYVGVLLEHLEGNIQLIAEGHIDLDRKFDGLSEKFDKMEVRMGGLENRMGGLEDKVDDLEREMKSSFKTVFDYLSAIDIELAEIKTKLEGKADKKDLDAIERRVLRLELDLGECKKQIAAARKA